MSLKMNPRTPQRLYAALAIRQVRCVAVLSVEFLVTAITRAKMMSSQKAWLWGLVLFGWAGNSGATELTRVTLKMLIETAQAQDPWIAGSHYRQAREEAFSDGAAGLPAPTVTLGLNNVPTSGFNLNQESMTQFQLGLQQTLPRGRTVALTRQKFDQKGLIEAHSRDARKADIVRRISRLYLEIFRHQQTAALIENDLTLVDQLIENALSQYTTGALGFHQQEVIQAQTERSRLIDRLNLALQRQDQNYAALSAWLGHGPTGDRLHFEGELAQLFQVPAAVLIQNPDLKVQVLAEAFAAHPLVQGLDQGVNAADTESDLAAERSKPQWGINARYGQRQDSAMGVSRADFLSLGVSFDLPMMNRRQLNSQVTAAIADREGVKTDRALMLRQIKAGYDLAALNYRHLLVRQQHYKTQLLQQVSEEATASLAAYTTESGTFSDVLQANMRGLKVKTDALNVDVDLHQSIIDLDYYLVAMNSSGEIMQGGAAFEARLQRTAK
jgi:hypothetical protein